MVAAPQNGWTPASLMARQQLDASAEIVSLIHAEDIRLLGTGSGVLQVEDMGECWKTIAELLQNPEQAQALGREAQAKLARQPDIIQQYLSAIEPYL